jgi:para-aminobenzoate synthetase component 1
MPDGHAIVRDVVHHGRVDVTSDLAALDSAGVWFLAMTFEGEPTCARFAESTPLRVSRATEWPPVATWSSSLDRPAYERLVDEIRADIARGWVYQANLCRVLSAPVPVDTDLDPLAAALVTANPAPYSLRLSLPERGIDIVCASPELYLRRRGDQWSSGPVKGTVGPGEPFPAKDVAENVMIVDLVRNDLGRVADVGSVTVEPLLDREAHPGLDHLVSTVHATARATWAEVIGATFPPGSVTGAPKSSALEVIRRLEPVPRGPYCGAVGWTRDGADGELAVAIRTFWRADGMLHLGVGAGITWGSEPGGEWEETELKARTLLQVAAG